MITKGSLGIYWAIPDQSGRVVYQEEVCGIIFYGYWSCGSIGEFGKNSASFEDIWSGRVDVRFREWEGQGMSNLSAEVKINSWPDEDEWLICIRRSLEWFVEGGAIISWCGSELSSPSLDVFSSVDSSGSVYAAYSERIGFVCGSGLNCEYQDVSPSELERFNRFVLGAV